MAHKISKGDAPMGASAYVVLVERIFDTSAEVHADHVLVLLPH
ncbi:MAG: hypothetical protein ACRYFE_03535 [Janthinobacterium lividum]